MIHDTSERPPAPAVTRRQVLRMGRRRHRVRRFPHRWGWSHHASRSLNLHNALTRENLELEYWANGEFVPEALKELNHFLRDPHNGKVTEIDPDLYHLIFDIARKLKPRESSTSCRAIARP